MISHSDEFHVYVQPVLCRFFSAAACLSGAFLATLVFSQAEPITYPSEDAFDLSSGTPTARLLPDDKGQYAFYPTSSYPGISWRAARLGLERRRPAGRDRDEYGSSSTQLILHPQGRSPGKELLYGFHRHALKREDLYPLNGFDRQNGPGQQSALNGYYPPPVSAGDNVWLNDQHAPSDLTKSPPLKIFMQKPPASLSINREHQII